MKQWSRYAENGYECSTRGDRRFSVLYARLRDGRTIEDAYQLDVKGYRRIGYTAMQAKRDRGAHAPVRLTRDGLWKGYLALWEQWAAENPGLVAELERLSRGRVLTDAFASSDISQARALAHIINSKEIK